MPGALRLLAFGVILRLAQLDIGTETSGLDRDFAVRLRVLAEDTVGGGFAVGGERPGMAAFRIVAAADEGAELAGLQIELAGAAARALPGIAAILARRIDVRTQHLVEHVEHLRDFQILDVVDRADEIDPEIPQHLLPGDFVVGDAVEFFLEIGGEIVFDVTREKTFQERDHDAALVLAMQPLLIEPDIAAILQHLQDRGIGRRPADAEFFHALDQRGFRKARRRLGEMLGDGEVFALQRFAFAHGGEAAAILVVAVVVAAFLVQRKKAVEFDDLAGGAQFQHARSGLRRDIDGGAFQFGGFHLARDGADPDQFIEPRLIVIEPPAHLGGAARQVGRADRFMRFLRVLGLGLILARRVRHIGIAVILADHLARLHDRRIVDLHAIGTHIGDEAGGLAADVDAFIQPLRDPHGMRRRKAELAAGFLLQRRGGEGRLRIAPRRFCLDRGDREVRGLDRLFEIFGLGAGADIEPLDLLAVGADQTRLEGVAARRRQRCDQRPVFARNEFFDFEFAVADQAQRHRLHAARRARARQLAPQHRREGKADQIIQRAARHIGIDQRAVDLARVLHRFGHRLLGDGVEHHALDLVILDRAFLFQDFQHVPGDRLALAVGVGRENQPVGAFQGARDVVEPAGRLGIDLPDHLEIGLRIDRSVLGRKVADMAERRQNLVGGAQIFVDRLGLGRRLDNDDIHVIPIAYGGDTGRSRGTRAGRFEANMGAEGP